jgi:hypothetical protein
LGGADLISAAPFKAVAWTRKLTGRQYAQWLWDAGAAAGVSQTLTCRAILMTLSWDTRYSSFDEDVRARPHCTTQTLFLAISKFAAMMQNLVSRITEPSYTASNPAKNPPQKISFMESVYLVQIVQGMLFLRSSLS